MDVQDEPAYQAALRESWDGAMQDLRPGEAVE